MCEHQIEILRKGFPRGLLVRERELNFTILALFESLFVLPQIMVAQYSSSETKYKLL